MKIIKLFLPSVTLIIAVFLPMQAAHATNCPVPEPEPGILPALTIHIDPDNPAGTVNHPYVDYINCRINEAGVFPKIAHRTERECVDGPLDERSVDYCLITRMDILYDTGTGLTYFTCSTVTQGPSANTGNRCFDPGQPDKAPAYGAGVNASASFGFIAAENNNFCVESAAVFPGTSIKDDFCLTWSPSF